MKTRRELTGWLIWALSVATAAAIIQEASGHPLDPNIPLLPSIHDALHLWMAQAERESRLRDFAANTWWEPNEPIDPPYIVIKKKRLVCTDPNDNDPLYWGIRIQGKLLKHSVYFIKGDYHYNYIIWDREVRPIHYEPHNTRVGYFVDICCTDMKASDCETVDVRNPQPKLRPKGLKAFAELARTFHD